MKYAMFVLMFLLTVVPPFAESTELDHRFIDPAFGGNPLNATYLLGDAQAQNTFKAPTPTPTPTPTPSSAATAASTSQSTLDAFKTNLERTVLSQLAINITNQIFPSNGSGGIKTGTFDFGDYVVTVSNATGGVNVTVSDIVSGATTTINIPTTLPTQ